MNEDQFMDDEAEVEQGRPGKPYRCGLWKVTSQKWSSKNIFRYHGRRVCRYNRYGKPGRRPSAKGAKGPAEDPN